MNNKDFKISFLTNEASANDEALMCDWRTGICGPVAEMEIENSKRDGQEGEDRNDGYK